MKKMAILLFGLSLLSLAGAFVNARQASQTAPAAAAQAVTATVETDPVPHGDDSADDPAIWVHPRQPAQSLIIGTDKNGGLALYDLAGKQLHYYPDGRMNNVDLRNGFRLGGRRVALVAAGNRTDNTIALYRVNETTRTLENVAARKITTLEVYGSCMYRSRKTGKYYYFVNDKLGKVEQWELFDDGHGKVDAKNVRTFNVGSITEGCVADDELGHFYIGEEKVALWKYRAEPDGGDARTAVDRVSGHLVADIEGLAIAYAKNGKGWLIASSQGDSTYAIYERAGDNRYVKSFRIVDGNGIDATSDTDGLDVTTANLGPAFPHGVFIAQDGANDQGNQNFKLVPWHTILR